MYPISKNQPPKKQKNHRQVGLPSGLAIVVSCGARTATYGLLQQLLDTSNYHPSKMRALRSPIPDPSTPLIWSCAGHESLPSIPTVPICHKCNIPSVYVGQGVEGPPPMTCRYYPPKISPPVRKPCSRRHVGVCGKRYASYIAM